MKKRIDLKRIYLHYIVKSSSSFVLFISIFCILFWGIAQSIELEVHETYEASITDTEVIVHDEICIERIDNKVYVYTDMNQEVLVLNIIASKCTNEGTYFLLEESQTLFSGKVTLEIITEKRNLLNKIFEVGIDNE